ncbi:MAG: hypothetical protein WCO71_01995 [Pseudomonadota bacterium]
MKTHIFKCRLLGTILTVFSSSLFCLSTRISACSSAEYLITGLTNTNERWLRDYLELESFIPASESDLDVIRHKVTTTDIFSQVTVTQSSERNGHCVVLIDASEKITRIPVIRGAYGGGTPLLILGGYETNAFGELMAIGGEVRRYGNMAPGAFFFFKSPRSWHGRGLWGGELSLDRRRRAFFDADSKSYGYAEIKISRSKLSELKMTPQCAVHQRRKPATTFQKGTLSSIERHLISMPRRLWCLGRRSNQFGHF